MTTGTLDAYTLHEPLGVKTPKKAALASWMEALSNTMISLFTEQGPMRPWCSAIFGSRSSRRSALRRSCVPSSSAPMDDYTIDL